MGGCLSKSSIPSSGGHTLGASPTPIDNRGRSQQSQKLPQQQQQPQQQPQQRGPRRQQHPPQTADARRSEAAAAAERRMKAVRLSPPSPWPELALLYSNCR